MADPQTAAEWCKEHHPELHAKLVARFNQPATIYGVNIQADLDAVAARPDGKPYRYELKTAMPEVPRG